MGARVGEDSVALGKSAEDLVGGEEKNNARGQSIVRASMCRVNLLSVQEGISQSDNRMENERRLLNIVQRVRGSRSVWGKHKHAELQNERL